MAEPKTFIERAEGLIKALGTIVTIVVVFGYPAIYFQLKSYNLPLHVIGYKNVLAAGIIPTLIFVGFFAFGYWLYKQFQKQKNLETIILPLAFVMPLFLIEIVALLTMMFYGCLLPFKAVLGWFGMNISRPGLITASLVITSLVFAAMALSFFFPKIADKARKINDKFDRQVRKYDKKKAPTLNPDPQSPETNEPVANETSTAKRGDPHPLFGAIGFAGVTYAGYVSLMWIIENRFVEFHQWLLPHKPVLHEINVVLTAIVIVLFWLSLMKNYAAGRLIFFALFALTFILLVFNYSTQWYKKIDSRLGGGKPTPVNLWVKTEDFPSPVLTRYQQTVLPADSSAYTNWQKGLLLLENEKEFAITTRDSAWIIIPKDKVVLFERVPAGVR